MTALLILNYDVHDHEKLEEYRVDASRVLLGADRGVLIASTAETEHLPEAAVGGTHTIILQFDDVMAARSVYESARYQDLLVDRLRSTRPHAAMIVPILT